jgi:hypothetical protein
MRQVKWASLAFLLGLIVVLNPGYSPAQFGKRPEGGGGFGKRPEGGEGGGFGKRSEGGGFGKRPEGGGGFGGAPASAPGGFGGAPAPLPPGGGMGGGGFGGGGMGGGGRGMGDPNQMWDWMARGQDSINLNDPQHSRTKERMLQRGEQIPPDGILTRQMFVAAAQQRMAVSGAPAPGAPGAPVAMVIGGAPGGPGVPMTVAMGGPMGGGGEDMATRRIKEQDRDGDGKVSFNEADDRLKPNFQKMDRNGDGFLDMEEYRAATGGGGGGRDRDRNGGMGPGGAGDYGFAGGSGDYGRRDDKRVTEEPKPVAMRYGHLPKDMPEWFDKDDGNKDGQVALHEWRRAGKDLSEFYAYDLNADGLVTADEFLRFGVLKTENEKIAAINNPDGVRPSFAGGGRGSGGFALPGSTPPSSDRISATNDKGSDKGKGKGDKGGKDEKAPDGGNGGQNPFRKKN